MFNNRSVTNLTIATVITVSVLVSIAGHQLAKAQQVAGVSIPQSPITATVVADKENEYRIGPGDELSIQVFNRPQLSRDERVDMSGMISMPLLDQQIRAVCYSESELANEIAKLYREHDLLKNPSVFVTVKDFQSQPVAVLGSVNQPGRFLLRRRIRLLELVVFFAGGPSVNAGSRIQVLPTGPAALCEEAPVSAAAKSEPGDGGVSNFTVYNLTDLLAGKDSANPYVHQGDIINIPAMEQAYIIGNVARPSPIQISGTVTLSRALAMVGGLLPNTKKDKIRISREVPGSNRTTEILIDLASADKSKGEDFPLQPGDVVQVAAKGWFQTSWKQMILSGGLPYHVIP